MIKKHNSIVRAEKIINSFINSMHLNDNIDGVVEVFKEIDKQGYVMKLYKCFEPERDLCIWIYEDLENKTIHSIIGNHINCNELNQAVGDNLKYGQYPVVSDIKKEIVTNLLEKVYKHYSKKVRI